MARRLIAYPVVVLAVVLATLAANALRLDEAGAYALTAAIVVPVIGAMVVFGDPPRGAVPRR